MVGLLILSSLLLGSSLSSIIAPRIIESFSIKFYTDEFAQLIMQNNLLAEKQTLDIVDIAVFVGISTGVFIVHSLFTKKTKLLQLCLLLVSLLIFLQTHFVIHSVKIVLLQILILEVVVLVLSRNKSKKVTYDSITVINGIFAGFFLFVVTRLFTTSFVIPFTLFALTPVVFSLYSTRWNKHPAFSLFVLSAFFPYSKAALSILAVTVFLLTSFKVKETTTIQKMYPYLVMFVFIYNPLFYVGTFDSLEEGFWLAWVQRLTERKVMYKNFFAYHPPIFTWGLNLFLQLTEHTLYYFRMYFHALQVVGTLIVGGLVMKMISDNKLRIITLIFIYAVLMRHLMNNVEIRLGLGILSLFPLFAFLEQRNGKVLFFSGLLSGISLFSSIEVGLVSTVSIVISLFFVSRYINKSVINSFLYYFFGLGLFCILMAGVLHYQGAFTEYIEQMMYVLHLFGNGYSNASIERTTLSNILLWNEVNAYLTSTALMWELTRFAVLGSLLFIFYKRFTNALTVSDIRIGILAVFSLLLFRTALGRSDQYHLMTVLIPAIILISALLESIASKSIAVISMVFLLLITGRSKVNDLLQFNLEKFQSYATPAGIYPDYLSPKTDIQAFPGTDVNSQYQLVEAITKNTTNEDTIFVFPQKPELYFLTERKNATSFDTPIIYLTESFQAQMISELTNNKPKLIIYNPTLAYYEISVDRLAHVNDYILNHYQIIETIGNWSIMESK